MELLFVHISPVASYLVFLAFICRQPNAGG